MLGQTFGIAARTHLVMMRLGRATLIRQYVNVTNWMVVGNRTWRIEATSLRTFRRLSACTQIESPCR